MGFKEGFKDFWNILIHPSKNYIKIIDYNQAIVERNKLRGELENSIERNFELGEQVDFLGNSLSRSQIDYTFLDNKYSDLRVRIPGIRGQLTRALKLCRNIKTGTDVIEERVADNQGNTEALRSWEEGCARSLETRMGLAEAKSEFLSDNAYGIATDVAIGTVVKLDPRIKKVPFLFYNSVTKNLTYTPATLKFFKIDKKEADSLTFAKLLRKVDSDYLKGSEGILSALTAGTKLSHYDAKTCGENPIDLKLTTYPVKSGDNPLGIGILLYDPKVSLTSTRNRNLIKNLDEIFHNVAEELSVRFGEMSGQESVGLV